MKQLVKGSAALTAVSIGEMAMRFIRTKCIALLLGPAGTGLLAQLAIFFELMRVWGDLGSRRGVIKQIAEQREAGRQSDRYGEVIKTSFFLAIVASCVTGLLVTLFSHVISQSLYGTPKYYPYIISLALLLPIASISTVTASIVKGNLEYMSFAKYTFISYLAVMVITPALIYFFHYWGAVLVQGLFFIAPLGSYLVLNSRSQFIFFSKKISGSILKEQFSYGFLQIYQATFEQIVRVLIAAWIVKELGLSSMGIYQVIITFSTVYLAIPIQAMSGYSLPLIAAAENSKDITRNINDSLRFLMFILVPVIALMMMWSEFFIALFFSKDFLAATLPLQIQLLGTLCVVILFPIAIAFQARGQLKALIATSGLYPIIYLALAWLFFDWGHLTGIAAAYLITSAIMAGVHYFLAKRFYGFHFLPKNKKLLLSTAIWVGLSLVAGTLVKNCFFSFFVSLLGMPWFIFSSKAHERDFLKSKYTSIKGVWKHFLEKYFHRPQRS